MGYYDLDTLTLGLDVGQKRDPSAVCVLEHFNEMRMVRHIQRLPLNTPYPEQASFIVALLYSGPLCARNILLRVDCTGVGLPIVDLIREKLAQKIDWNRNIEVEALYFRHGESYNRKSGTIGKMFLVANLQMLLQQGLIKMDDTPETRALTEELLNYEIRVSEAGKDTYGVFATGKHDDLATALALAALPLPASQVPLQGYESGSSAQQQQQPDHEKQIEEWQKNPFDYPYTDTRPARNYLADLGRGWNSGPMPNYLDRR